MMFVIDFFSKLLCQGRIIRAVNSGLRDMGDLAEVMKPIFSVNVFPEVLMFQTACRLNSTAV